MDHHNLVNGSTAVAWGMDSKPSQQIVSFGVVAEMDGDLSAKGGFHPAGHERAGEPVRPYFRDVVYIMLKDPDSRDVICKPATDEHRRMFPREWAAFEAARSRTPLYVLPNITPAVLESMRAFGLKSMEDVVTRNEDELWDELKPFLSLAKRYLALKKPRFRLVDGEFRQE